MINIVFWNLNRKPLQNLLAKLAKNYAVDIFILAENGIDPSVLLGTLNTERTQYKKRPWSLCNKIDVFTKFPIRFLQPTEESDRFLICRLNLPARADILLAMAHLPSKANYDEMSQLTECQELAQVVRKAETKAGHTRTILVGDLNVNPFEKAVVLTSGLHAVMAREIALRNSRKVQKKSYQFFYNPMWRHFGDRADGPPGTYYYGGGGHASYFWNIFDQVLVRPDLIQCFPDDELRILTSIGDVKLLGEKGQPNRNVASDHLPVFFKLDI